MIQNKNMLNRSACTVNLYKKNTSHALTPSSINCQGNWYVQTWQKWLSCWAQWLPVWTYPLGTTNPQIACWHSFAVHEGFTNKKLASVFSGNLARRKMPWHWADISLVQIDEFLSNPAAGNSWNNMEISSPIPSPPKVALTNSSVTVGQCSKLTICMEYIFLFYI